MKQPTDSKCWMYCKVEEHIKHTVEGCTTLAPSEHTNRHNKVAGSVCWTICKHYGLLTSKYYEHTPGRVISVNSTTILCDLPVITD